MIILVQLLLSHQRIVVREETHRRKVKLHVWLPHVQSSSSTKWGSHFKSVQQPYAGTLLHREISSQVHI